MKILKNPFINTVNFVQAHDEIINEINSIGLKDDLLECLTNCINLAINQFPEILKNLIKIHELVEELECNIFEDHEVNPEQSEANAQCREQPINFTNEN